MQLRFDEEYLLAYVLDPTESKRQLIVEAAKKLNKKLVVILDLEMNYEFNRKRMNLDKNIIKPGVVDWLAYFQNASYVITDSFHGACFSIIFKKKFIAIKNRMTQRFDSLGRLIGYPSLFHKDCISLLRKTDIFAEAINYEDIHQRINVARKESVEWLHSALNIEIKSHKDNNSADVILKLLKSLRDQTDLFDKFKQYYAYEEGQKEEINAQMEKGKTWYEVICLKNNIIPENSKLKEMSRLQEYFTFLKENSKYLIVLSGADECSIHWAKFVEASGLTLRKDIRWRESYVAIIDGGTVKVDEKSKEEININYTFAAGHPKCSMEYVNGHLKVDCMPLEHCKIRVKSKGYTESTGAYKSEIIVDNIDYSINKIGINIVVIDKETGKVGDSINVNTYSDGTLKINRS